jgi:hypothetical protein
VGGASELVVVCEVGEPLLPCLIPLPNKPPLPLSGGAPRAVDSGNAYSLATGLAGSMCTGEPFDADAAAGGASTHMAQTTVIRRRARTL